MTPTVRRASVLRSSRCASALTVVALAAAVLTLAGCTDRGGPASKPEPGDKVVAKVGDEVIWTSDVKREAVAQGVINEGEPLDPASTQFRSTLDEVIDQKLLAREALRMKLDKDPRAARRVQAAREKVLGDVLVEGRVDKAVNETAIRSLYAEQQRLAKTGEEIRARQIVVPTQADADAVKKLLSTGASFEAVAMQRSTDQNTRFNGGDLGYFTLDAMPEPYGVAMKTAKTGDLVGPFETAAGFVVAKIDDRRPEQPISLDEARPQIVRFLTYDEIRTLLAKLRAATRVQITLPPPVKVPGGSTEPASAAPANATAANVAAPGQNTTPAAAPNAGPGAVPVPLRLKPQGAPSTVRPPLTGAH
jgi:peptidyl-prolyl cis-trans isomerase C